MTSYSHHDHREIEIARDLQNLDKRQTDDDHLFDINLTGVDSFEDAAEVTLGLFLQTRSEVLARSHAGRNGGVDKFLVDYVEQCQITVRRRDSNRDPERVHGARRKIYRD